jgi:hypothetical protein
MAYFQGVALLDVLYNLSLPLHTLSFSDLGIALLGGLFGYALSEVVGHFGFLCLADDGQNLPSPVSQLLLHRFTFCWCMG